MRGLHYEEMTKYYISTFPEHQQLIESWDEITIEKLCKLTAVIFL